MLSQSDNIIEDDNLNMGSLKLKKFNSNPVIENSHRYNFYRVNPRQVEQILEINEKEKHSSNNEIQDDISEKSTKPDEHESSSGLSKKSSFNVSRKNSGSSQTEQESLLLSQNIQITSNDHEENFEKLTKSKWLQNEYLVEGQRNRVFEELIKPNISQFAQEKYGHFIIILVLKQGLNGHKQLVIEQVYFALDQLSRDQYGHKIIEQCLDVCIQEQLPILQMFIDYYLNETNFKRLKLHLDQYGNYIIQKLLQMCCPQDQSILLQLLKEEVIYESQNLIEKGQSLSSNQYGCLVFQAILDSYQNMRESQNNTQNKKLISQIIKIVVKSVVQLSNSQFSNYMIQQIIIKQVQPFFYDVCNKAFQMKNFLSMSTHKYGSNVAEKCVIGSTNSQFEILSGQLIEPNNHENLKILVNDKFGNFVSQRLYERGEFKLKKALFDVTLELKKSHELSEYGQKAFQFMNKQFQNDQPPHFHHHNHKNHNHHHPRGLNQRNFHHSNHALINNNSQQKNNYNQHYNNYQGNLEYRQRQSFNNKPFLPEFQQQNALPKFNFLPPTNQTGIENRFNGFKTNPLHSRYTNQMIQDSRIPIQLFN